jgi:hypothetical protein
MQPRARSVLAAASLNVLVLAGCPDKKPPPPRDAGPEAGMVDAGLPDAAGPEAANEGRIKRYGDEALLDHVPLTVMAPSALATTAYPKGSPVATLQKGTAVVKLSERNGYFRVTFADDKTPSLRMMGWVARFAFDERDPDAGAPKKLTMPRCPTTMGIQVTVLDGDKVRCAYECGADLECSAAGGTCEAAAIVPDNGELLPVPNYTTVCTAPALDGGVDAGKPIYFGMTRSASGKCAKFFQDAPKVGDLCYRSCKVDTDCPEPGVCTNVVVGPGAKTAKLCVMH